MMSKNPCRNCPPEERDYNSRKCMACQSRIDYVASIGDMTHSIPLELSDLNTEFKKESEMPEQQNEKKTNRSWTEEEKEFLRLNRKKMTYKQMAEALGRTDFQIGNAIHRFKIKSSSPKKDKPTAKLKDLADFEEAEAIGLKSSNSPPDLSSEAKRTTDAPDGSKKDFFILDFSDRVELYDLLISAANLNFRTPKEQALFFIHQGLNAERAGAFFYTTEIDHEKQPI